MSAVDAFDVVTCAVTLTAKLSLAVVAAVKGVTCCVVDFLITCLTPTCTDFEAFEPSDVVQEIFFADFPTCAHRGKQTETFVFAKTARTVVPQCNACKIFVH